jgi:hypothetical protein
MGNLGLYSLVAGAALFLLPAAALVGFGLWGSRPSVLPPD